jgi:myo-inositol-1(or 4)-monophosphatase
MDRMAAAPEALEGLLSYDWLGACRRAGDGLRAVLSDHPTSRERVTETGERGEGGDRTLVIDAAAEDAVFAQLDRLHTEGARFTAVSEERGEVDFGDPGVRVLVDPIDGSMNAKRGIPYFSISIAVADGSRMGDVHFGFVHDLGTGEEWTAARGEGAWLGDARLGAQRPKDQIEILSVEATVAGAVADKAIAFAGFAHRLRIMGSLALSLCHLAAGRVDAVCSLKEARAVDIAAAQLLLKECSLPIVFADAGPFDAAPLDTAARSPVAAAGTQELAERLAHIVAT